MLIQSGEQRAGRESKHAVILCVLRCMAVPIGLERNPPPTHSILVGCVCARALCGLSRATSYLSLITIPE